MGMLFSNPSPREGQAGNASGWPGPAGLPKPPGQPQMAPQPDLTDFPRKVRNLGFT